jgi:SpoIID/LytB domain protein
LIWGLVFGVGAVSDASSTESDSTAPPVKDRLSLLYSNVISLNQHGVPLIAVEILRSQKQVRIQSKSPMRIRLGRRVDGEILAPAGSVWTFSLEGGHPGKRKAWVAAERFGVESEKRIEDAMTRWRRRGLKPVARTSGQELVLGEMSVDTRLVTIAVASAPSRSKAEAIARRLKGKHPISGKVFEEHVELPSGRVVAGHVGSTAAFEADSVISVDLDPGSVVEVVGDWQGRRTGVQRYRGRLYFLPGEDGRLSVVNELNAEELVEGVLPGELYTRAPLEALKAQAVAARTLLVSKLGRRHPLEPFHLCSESHCQVYRGYGAATPHTQRAVRETRSQVTTYQGILVDTVFHASCGGHTEAYHRVWGGPEKTTMTGSPDGEAAGALEKESVVASYITQPPGGVWCATNGVGASSFRWSKSIGGERLTRAVNRKKEVGEVVAIRALDRGVSGRVVTVEFVGTEGSYVARGESLNRRLLGGLRSGLWIVQPDGLGDGQGPAQWVFTGGGFGHGVGLCQYGAIGMAKAGHAFDEILEHYYRGSELRSAW